MNNLFSIFDPSAFLGLPINWLALSLVLIIWPALFWASSGRALTLLTSPTNYVKNELSAVNATTSSPATSLVLITIFTWIVTSNSMGLVPFVFTPTSHLVVTMALALPLWGGQVIWGVFKTAPSIAAHLVPMGSPGPLSPLIVLIELVSNLIRPITLSVRLAANIVAGHLLLCLLAGEAPSASWSAFGAITAALLGLLVLESSVAVIQAYVFTVLNCLYLEEVHNANL